MLTHVEAGEGGVNFDQRCLPVDRSLLPGQDAEDFAAGDKKLVLDIREVEAILRVVGVDPEEVDDMVPIILNLTHLANIVHHIFSLPSFNLQLHKDKVIHLEKIKKTIN